VFPHRGHVSELNKTVAAAWQWLPASGRKLGCDAGAPTFIEHYGEKFDPDTGFGDIEVWFPVKS
jgi:AraC family transcriptional regulator